MIVIEERNVHAALHTGLKMILQSGVSRESRYGKVLMFPQPVTTVYKKPLERVVFWPERDANPFFHFAESLWMLAGRNDVSFLTSFLPRMAEFSDNGETFHGAYGYRWRKHFGVDQLQTVVNNLKLDTNDRRQVIQMWDAKVDLPSQKGKKDLPCNTQVYFSVTHEGNVDMLVTNRSNDLILGCYGANAVHFSYLHEFVARALQLPVGCYRQMSNNLHVYEGPTLEKVRSIVEQPSAFSPYDLEVDGVQLRRSIYSMMSTDHLQWLADLDLFLMKGAYPGMDPFFRRVAYPIFSAHSILKQKKNPQRFKLAIDQLSSCVDTPWALACIQWIQRREEKFNRAKDDGVGHE